MLVYTVASNAETDRNSTRSSKGSTYAFPARPPNGAKSIAEVNAAFQSLQSNIKSASSILIVGAGPTGIEFAGELIPPRRPIPISLYYSKILTHRR